MKKKLDSRIKVLIQNGVKTGHRTFFVIVGDRGKDQVINLHYLLAHAAVRPRPSVLWCYKKELSLSSHKKKRMRQIKRLALKGLIDKESENPFELFVSSTDIRWCYYTETHQILGQTFGMCVLQDFESITPNLLARTIETVEGGGLLVILLQTMSSLRQLFSMTMEIHNRFRTATKKEVVPRFNERFILSLAACPSCLVVDDEMNILAISSYMQNIKPLSDNEIKAQEEIETRKRRDVQKKAEKLANSSIFGLIDEDEQNVQSSSVFEPSIKKIGTLGLITNSGGNKQSNINPIQLKAGKVLQSLLPLARTSDQCSGLFTLLNVLCQQIPNFNQKQSSSQSYSSPVQTIVSLTAARGRGKSAALGLAVAGALSLGLSSILVTSPSPENLSTQFEFIIKGLTSAGYIEHADFEAARSPLPQMHKSIIRIDVFKTHRQTVQYISPTAVYSSSGTSLGSSASIASGADLLVVDEAAAIPLPLVRALVLGGQRENQHSECLIHFMIGFNAGIAGGCCPLVFISSTISGYEGTGRSLTLKLMKELRKESLIEEKTDHLDEEDENKDKKKSNEQKKFKQKGQKDSKEKEQLNQSGKGRRLIEIELNTPIRYSQGDQVEQWLNALLCLSSAYSNPSSLNGDINIRRGPSLSGSLSLSLPTMVQPPEANKCNLYLVNRDTLFSFHKASEAFLQKLVSLFVSSHYRNSPNDLLMMSDAPAHQMFVLLGPISPTANMIPDILCALQVCLEGEINREIVESQLNRGQRSAGDLIPWTIANQFQDPAFASLSGARIIRIATHPELNRNGYGLRSLQQLSDFYSGLLYDGKSNEGMERRGLIGGNEMQEKSQADIKDKDKDENINEQNNKYLRKRMRLDEQINSPSILQHQSQSLQTEQLLPQSNLPPLLSPLHSIRPPSIIFNGDQRKKQRRMNTLNKSNTGIKDIDQKDDNDDECEDIDIIHNIKLGLHWIGTSFGLTLPLFNFWQKSGMLPVYIRQTPNELTGEYSCVMIKQLKRRGRIFVRKKIRSNKRKQEKESKLSKKEENEVDEQQENLMKPKKRKRQNYEEDNIEDDDQESSQEKYIEEEVDDEDVNNDDVSSNWLGDYVSDFTSRLCTLLSFDFASFPTALALSLVDPTRQILLRNLQSSSRSQQSSSFDKQNIKKQIKRREITFQLTNYDLLRIKHYCQGLIDFHMIIDVIPSLAKLFFTRKLSLTNLTQDSLSLVQASILAGIGLQRKTLDNLIVEFEVSAEFLLSQLQKLMRRLWNELEKVVGRIDTKSIDDNDNINKDNESINEVNKDKETKQNKEGDQIMKQ